MRAIVRLYLSSGEHTMAIIPFPSRRPGACAVCGAWPEANRQAMRSLIDDEIFLKGAVCDDCLLAFWERLFASEPKPPRANRPKH
jgi:hypothetical protein